MEEEIFNTELGKKILSLIKASFKVSDLISDLVLREKIKNQILNVYESFFSAEGGKKYSDLLKEIDVLDNFFFLAGQLSLVKDNYLRILRNGFLVFKSRIILMLNEPPKTSMGGAMAVKKEAVKPEIKLNDRQKKILDKFSAKDGSQPEADQPLAGAKSAGGQNKNTFKLAEILDFFPDLSELILYQA